MCVAAIAWNAHPDWLLVAAGNRDEFHARPALPLALRPDGIIAGTDLTGGGTWLGAAPEGRFALVTNYRVPEGSQPGRPSRGKLVTDLLQGIDAEDLAEEMARMNPFNLVFVRKGGARFMTSHPAVEIRDLAPGIHGLSNGGFDVPWGKTLKLNRAVAQWLNAATDTGAPDFAPLFAALRDEAPLPADDGPEPRFSPVFIRDAVYGTRCSTVAAIDRKGRGTIVERSFDAAGSETGEVWMTFDWP